LPVAISGTARDGGSSYSAGLATVALLLSWLVLEAVARVADVVTIDRDEAAGLRLGGWDFNCT
jgi:hypothetical protein